jgi:hypothetical protein
MGHRKISLAERQRGESPFTKGGFRGIFKMGILPRSWRAAILASLLLLAALGCANIASSPASTPTAAPPAGPAGGPQFSAFLATTDLAVGTNRVSFGIIDLDNMPVRTPRAQVQSVYFPPGQDKGQVRQTATAEFIQWPPPGERGVYVTTLDFDAPGEGTQAQPGLWALQITTTTGDGEPVQAQTIVEVREESSTPAIGSPAPRSVTPTARDGEDLSNITTDDPPDPDLYQLSIQEALETGKPLVVVFATPAFCVSATCGPQVEMVSQVKERHLGEANFIHVEVFENPHLIQGGRPTGGLAPAVEEWGLLTEPWTFVIDREGKVHAKFEQFTPAEEIEQALLEVL